MPTVVVPHLCSQFFFNVESYSLHVLLVPDRGILLRIVAISLQHFSRQYLEMNLRYSSKKSLDIQCFIEKLPHIINAHFLLI